MLFTGHSAAQETTKHEYVIEPFRVVPQSYADLWSESTLVARIRIVTSEPKLIVRPDYPPSVTTQIEARVIKVFKGSSPGMTVGFYQSAGYAETPEFSVKITDEEPLIAGHEYIVFLRPYDYFHSLSLSAGRDAAYEIVDQNVHAQGKASISRERSSVSLGRFLDELARISRQRPAQ
jgi:hypothetical protein